MYSRGERGRRAAGSSVPGCGRASAGAGTDPEWCAMGAESEVGPGGCSPRQSEEQGAPFPGGIKTPQPQHHCAQHRAAEADGGGCVPILPAAFSQAETPAEETQEAGPAWCRKASRTPFASGQCQQPDHHQTQTAELEPALLESLHRTCQGVCATREGDGPRGADGHAWPRPLPLPLQTQIPTPPTTQTRPAGSRGGGVRGARSGSFSKQIGNNSS